VQVAKFPTNPLDGSNREAWGRRVTEIVSASIVVLEALASIAFEYDRLMP
jgi:hypothetical protein